jgi:ABC-type antimicrobial peptide transport system permease subunit
MGRLLLVCRLAVKDLHQRPAQAMLLLLAIAAGAATLTLGLALQGTSDNPYARTRAATNGPDVVATVFTAGSSAPGPATTAKPGDANATAGSDEPGAAALMPLSSAPGVIARSGPFPVTWTLLRSGHTIGSAEVEGRTSAASSVDQPKLLQGSWVRPGGVVVEAGFASMLGLHVGDRLNLGSISFPVVGVAVTSAIPAYPNTCSQAEGCFLAHAVASHNPGLIWATQADTTHITGTFGPDAYFLNLKLKDPSTAAAFADRYNASTSPTAPFLLTWQHIRDGDAQTLAKVQQILQTGSGLLALLAVASVAILVGGRMVEQTRRVGLLKAVGATPWLVAGVLLFEHVLVGLCAAVLGLVAGRLAAPLIDGPSAGLLGASGAPSVSGATVASVIALALGVAIMATFVPAIRAARQSTVAALNDSARDPRRREAVIRLSAHLPVSLLLGVRLIARRPRRVLLSVFSVAVTATGLVLVAILRATKANWSLGPGVTQATTIISFMLVLLAAVNAVFIAWTTALETRHPAALARALGATPEQITTGMSVAQLLPALVGALLGILGGIGIYDAARSGPGVARLPSALWLAAMVVLTLLVIAVLTAVPTRFGARRPVAEVLQADAA